jgi:hypothetical protein
MLCLLRINEAERRMTIPFTIYKFKITKTRLATPKPPLSNIDVSAVVVKKIMGVNSKNKKPATILLLKLFWDREIAKKLRAPNIMNENRRVINNWIPTDISTAPFEKSIVYCIRKQ